MAKKSGVSIRSAIYSTFRGADFSTDPSLVEKYRSPLCTNIVADGGGMPQKRDGWRVLHTVNTSWKVHGLHAGIFNGEVKKLAHVGSRFYTWDDETTPVQVKTGVPTQKSRSVYLNGKLWIVTGGTFYEYDGTTVQKASDDPDVYIPTTTITRMPTGGGVSYEDVNMLTPYRKNGFQTDGSAKTFTLDGDIDDSGTVTCWVWGVETVPDSIDRANGTVTFTTAPAAPDAGQEDGLVVQFPHTVTGYADRINKCTVITTFGVGTNDRVVLSGNPDFPNLDWISGIGDPTYFPDLSYSSVGSESTAILGYCRIGSCQAIVKGDDGNDSTIFLRRAEMNDGDAVFPLQQAIAGVGAVSPGSFASLLDDPLFLSRNGVYAITSNSITSEKICQGRSFYVNAQLTKEEGLSDAEAVIWNGMYLLSLPNGHVYAMDGRQSKSYKSASLGDFVYECYYWENVPARTWLCWKSGTEESLYFGTEDGRICKVNSDITTMDRYSDGGTRTPGTQAIEGGQAIDAVWATKYDDDGTPAIQKTMQKRGCCVTIKPYARSSGTVYFRSDRTSGTERPVATRQMDILDFSDIDFERFTFNTDDSPQEIFLNRKVKNYKRLQIIVRNSEVNEGFGIFQITKHYVTGNYAKR